VNGIHIQRSLKIPTTSQAQAQSQTQPQPQPIIFLTHVSLQEKKKKKAKPTKLLCFLFQISGIFVLIPSVWIQRKQNGKEG
jgi:trehalose-6-phosphate synthase